MTPDRPDSSGLREYVYILRRGWWIVVLTTVALTVTAYALSSRQDKVYESSSSVFLNFNNLGNSVSELAQVFYQDPQRSSQTQASLAQLPVVADRAVEIAGVDRTGKELLGRSAVEPSRNADLLTFTVQDDRPETAEQLATAYARAYTEYRVKVDTSALVKARRGVEAQIAGLEEAVAGESGRERRRQTTLLNQLRGKVEQLRTAEALQGSNAQLVRTASAAAQTAPQPKRDAILAGILGILLGVGLAFGRSALNTRVRSVEEVRERLRAPLISRIPHLRMRSREQVLMLSDPHAAENEAFRMLAINMDVLNLDRGARTIMVTSAHRGEGKSTTLANLAVAHARRGKHVVLVDMDLRAPAVGRFFGIGADRTGLADVVLGATTLDDALVDVPIMTSELGADANGNGHHPDENSRGAFFAGRLEVLAAGPVPSDHHEFLASPPVADLLHQLSERADLVLIDAPPILRVSDPLGLTSRIDALFSIVRLTNIRRHTLDELRIVLEMAPIVHLGFVATGKGDTEEDPYRYGYYGYGYGYGNEHRGLAARIRRRPKPPKVEVPS